MSKLTQTFKNKSPTLGKRVYIHDSAVVIGDVTIGDDCSVWPTAVIRGDMHSISIGSRTSIQDGSILHITHASDYNQNGYPLNIGEDVTVGHNASLHGCTIKSRCLIGIGSIVLDGAILEDEVILAAGSLVPQGKHLESGFVYKGNPALKTREISKKERSFLQYTAYNYLKLKNSYLNN